jgi:hypothetical protein
LEPECAKEKKLLINLASKFNSAINELMNNFCVNTVDSPEYKLLSEQFDLCSKSVMDKDFFETVLKDNFGK